MRFMMAVLMSQTVTDCHRLSRFSCQVEKKCREMESPPGEDAISLNKHTFFELWDVCSRSRYLPDFLV